MKNILLALIIIFTLSIFSIGINPSYADDCFLFDGTYIGAATITSSNGGKDTRPLFIVVANKHITGFFAPENQNQHHNQIPGGSSFNLGGLTVSTVYTLSLTAGDKILLKSTDGTINGKAQLGSVDGGSGSFSGYYNSDVVSDFAPGDFLNIGSDGSVILKVAIDKGLVHAFGKINASGEFVQAFPEKGKGPIMHLSISGSTADIETLINGNSSTTTLRKFPGASCGGSNPTSSSGGTPSDKPAFVSIFLGALNNLAKLSSTSLPGAETEALALQDIIRGIKFVFLTSSTPKDCTDSLESLFEMLPENINDVKIALCCANLSSCSTTQSFTLIVMQEDQSTIKENGSLDENNNAIFDICEQSSIFSEEEALSLVSDIFNRVLKEIEVNSKIARQEARKLFGKANNNGTLFTQISKSLRRIRTALKVPATICNLGIKDDIEALTEAAHSAYIEICVKDFNTINSSINSECNDGTPIRVSFDKLFDAGNIIEDTLIKVDSNKNDIVDICE